MSDEELLVLKNDLHKKWKGLESLINHPRLHVAEYFYSIRNEIDLATESLLGRLIQSGSDENAILKINSIRTDLLQELVQAEKLILDQLSTVVSSSDLLEAKASCDSIGSTIEQEFSSSSSSSINDLEDQYERLMKMIFDEANKWEKRILSKQSFVFVPVDSKSGFPGLLVHFANDFVGKSEMDCFK